MMTPQAAPGTGVGPGEAKHPGDDPEKGGHGPATAGRVQGKKIGAGRIRKAGMTGNGGQVFPVQAERRNGRYPFL